MANAVFPKFKENLLAGNAGWSLSAATVKVLALSSVYNYNAADVYYSDISATASVFRSTALSAKTFTNGTFDAGDKTLTAVTGTAIASLLLYTSATNTASGRLIAFIDTGTNLPVTPNGGDIIVSWNGSGIFTL